MKPERASIVLAFALAACQASTQTKKTKDGPQPDWVAGNSGQYPRAHYLTGMGSADDRESAEGKARSEISRVFSTSLKSQTDITETEDVKSSSGKTTRSDYSQSLSDKIEAVTKQVQEGVELADAWRDKATMRYYALAVLDREKAINMFRDKISDFDKQAAEWKSQMDQAADRLSRTKYAMKLTGALKAREDLNAQLRALDPGGRGADNPLNAAEMRSKAWKSLTSLDVSLSLAGDDSGDVRTGIVKGLNSLGLQAKAADASTADIVIEGSLETLQRDLGQWQRAQATVNVSLKDGHSAKVFRQFASTDRQDSPDIKEAARRVRASLAQKVAADIKDAVTSYFEDQ